MKTKNVSMWDITISVSFAVLFLLLVIGFIFDNLQDKIDNLRTNQGLLQDFKNEGEWKCIDRLPELNVLDVDTEDPLNIRYTVSGFRVCNPVVLFEYWGPRDQPNLYGCINGENETYRITEALYNSVKNMDKCLSYGWVKK